MTVPDSARWLYETANRIRDEAGHDAAKFEALLDDPALAQEALEKFPDRPQLYSLLTDYLSYERYMARRGFFPRDGSLTDEQHAEFIRQNHELDAEWARNQRDPEVTEAPWFAALLRRLRATDTDRDRGQRDREDDPP